MKATCTAFAKAFQMLPIARKKELMANVDSKERIGNRYQRSHPMTNLCVSFLEPEFTYEIWQDDMCVAGSDSLDLEVF